MNNLKKKNLYINCRKKKSKKLCITHSLTHCHLFIFKLTNFYLINFIVIPVALQIIIHSQLKLLFP